MTIYIKVDTNNRVSEVTQVFEDTGLDYSAHTIVEALPTGFSDGVPMDWTYVGGVFTHSLYIPLVSLELLRLQRDKLLSESDWTQGRDVILANDLAWTVYRTALRDITGGYTPVAEPVWPEEPS